LTTLIVFINEPYLCISNMLSIFFLKNPKQIRTRIIIAVLYKLNATLYCLFTLPYFKIFIYIRIIQPVYILFTYVFFQHLTQVKALSIYFHLTPILFYRVP